MTTLPFSDASFTFPIAEAIDESATAERADALFNAVRRANETSVLFWSGIGPLLVALTWLNQQFWAGWIQRAAEEGRPSAGQWMTMILFGQFARPLTHLFGKTAERAIERRRSALPKDHAHALTINDPRLLHLSLIGIPVGLPIAGRTEIIEFARLDGETHVLWGDRSACLWVTTSDDPVFIAMTNVSTPATAVYRRKGCIEVIVGDRSSHISDASLANILEEMDLGKRDTLSRDIESTSLSTNAAQTVRFELLS